MSCLLLQRRWYGTGWFKMHVDTLRTRYIYALNWVKLKIILVEKFPNCVSVDFKGIYRESSSTVHSTIASSGSSWVIQPVISLSVCSSYSLLHELTIVGGDFPRNLDRTSSSTRHPISSIMSFHTWRSPAVVFASARLSRCWLALAQ